MEPEQFSKGLQDLHLVDAADVHPPDGRFPHQDHLFRFRDGPFVELAFPILIHGNLDRLGFLFSDMDQRTGGQSRLAGMFMDELHTFLSLYAEPRQWSRGLKTW